MDERFADFWDHVEELRSTLIRSFLVVGLGFVFFLCFYRPIFHFLTHFPVEQLELALVDQKVERIRLVNSTDHPLPFVLPSDGWFPFESEVVKKGNNEGQYLLLPHQTVFYDKIADSSLLIMGPVEGISLVLKCCFWLSLALTAPVWGSIWLQFILPGLKRREQAIALPFMLLSVAALAAGAIFAYYVTLPVANEYLYSFNSAIGKNSWTLPHYVDYLLFLCLGHAVAAEIALLLFVLVHFRFFSVEALIGKRRHMVVVAFILGALLTPPDILSQLLLAIPLIVLYEGAILYAKARAKDVKTT